MRISSRRLGEFLVERRVLSQDVLDQLLATERTGGTPLSALLVEGHFVSEQDLTAAVANELGVPYVDVAERSILPDVWAVVPEDLARGYLAVAVERRAEGLLVAMEDPSDDQTVRALEEVLDQAVVPAVAGRGELARLVEQMYGAVDADLGGPGDEGAAPAPVAGPPPFGLDDLLQQVLQIGASDLHLTVGVPPVVRLEGELRRLEGYPVLNGSEVRRLVLGMLSDRQREQFDRTGEVSASHAIPGQGRFRVAAFVQRNSVGAVLRLVPGAIPAAEDLGLPDSVIEWADGRRGLVLVCGPHGSGTSTTVAALVDRINRSRACHILTVEQPIEFLHHHARAVVNQRAVGEDTESFETGVRSALRQDPDVLVVGDLPDLETIRHVLAAAETGQLVLATIRTVDAVKTIERIVDVFPPDQQTQIRLQMAHTLRGIVVQQLVPAIGGGVALAVEVLLPTPEVVRYIREGDTANLIKAIIGGVSSGMGTMDQSLAELVQEGLVSVDAAAERAVDPAELRYLTSGPTRSWGHAMDGALAMVVCFVVGIPVGAFLNVVIDRVPDRVPLRGPREGEVAAPVSWLGLPAQPWLLRAGRGPVGPLPRPWLLVELVTALLFAIFGERYGGTSVLPPLLVLCAALVAVSVVDLRLLRIPDRITFPALALAVPIIAVTSISDVGVDPFISALIGAVVYFVLLLLPHLVYPRGMGFGDVKLALLMGLYLGWAGWTADESVLGPLRLVLNALILGCILGVVFGISAQLITRRRGAFPFGPALAVGCLVVLYFAPDLRA